MFNSILETTTSNLSFLNVIICIATSLVLGLVIALVHMKTCKYNKNFVITLTILPMLVQVVMLMVNGNLGTSVAVLGAFSLIRFRSIPGNSREIASIFFAMAIGLSVGMGQIYFACLITIIISLVFIISYKTKFGEVKEEVRKLKILIPEDLDYTEVFDDIFTKFTTNNYLTNVKTVNMGSMFELNYDIKLKNIKEEKKFIDELRIRNGNLKIILSHPIDQETL